MQLVRNQFPGLMLLLRVNADRIFAAGTILVGLLAGAFLGSVLVRAF